MSDFNTFTGKTVDDAIGEACRFFATERDKLEVEIISGGSTGIFGLVGKKKAQIKARRRLDPAVSARMQADEEPVRQEAAPTETAPDEPRQERKAPREGRKPRPQREAAPVAEPTAIDDAVADGGTGDDSDAAGGEGAEAASQRREGSEGRRSRSRRSRSRRSGSSQGGRDEARRDNRPARTETAPQPEEGDDASLDAAIEDEIPDTADQTPASQELLDLAADIMKRLLTPILEQEPVLEVEGTASRVNVLVKDDEHSGLLIGREGQTLAALQYLANRIIVRSWETPVRLQVNTGEYREKQDDNLRRMALYLADKAKSLGRPQSTKPLSSYHRRVVHLTLQADETIQTRSKGDGPMKRVIIVPRRPKGDAPAQQ